MTIVYLVLSIIILYLAIRLLTRFLFLFGSAINTSQLGIISKDIIRIGCWNNSYNAPDDAEDLRKGEHCHYIINRGRYGGRVGPEDHVYYICPSCKRRHNLIFKHGDTVLCKCGLYSQTYGNSLRVWK